MNLENISRGDMVQFQQAGAPQYQGIGWIVGITETTLLVSTRNSEISWRYADLFFHRSNGAGREELKARSSGWQIVSWEMGSESRRRLDARLAELAPIADAIVAAVEAGAR